MEYQKNGCPLISVFPTYPWQTGTICLSSSEGKLNQPGCTFFVQVEINKGPRHLCGILAFQAHPLYLHPTSGSRELDHLLSHQLLTVRTGGTLVRLISIMANVTLGHYILLAHESLANSSLIVAAEASVTLRGQYNIKPKPVKRRLMFGYLLLSPARAQEKAQLGVFVSDDRLVSV